jgi:O-antigen ligase
MDSTSVESTQLRYFAWKASSELVRESVWLGYGTGDVEDVLIQKYKEKNYIGLLKKNLNAHNQYLQTGLSVGIPGVLVLVIYFVVSFVWAFRHRNTAFFIYLIITFMAFLFESYLETRAGVFYLAFFSSFFLSLNGSGNSAGQRNDVT